MADTSPSESSQFDKSIARIAAAMSIVGGTPSESLTDQQAGAATEALDEAVDELFALPVASPADIATKLRALLDVHGEEGIEEMVLKHLRTLVSDLDRLTQ